MGRLFRILQNKWDFKKFNGYIPNALFRMEASVQSQACHFKGLSIVFKIYSKYKYKKLIILNLHTVMKH